MTLFITYIVLMYMYSWYLTPAQGQVLNAIIILMASSIFVLWMLFPSRIAVGVVATIGVSLPGLYDGISEGEFNFGRITTLAILVLLLVWVTHWRCRLSKNATLKPGE